MQGGILRFVSLLTALFALVVSVDLSPDAADMLLARGKGDKSVRVENVYYSCVKGNAFAMVRNGRPDDANGYSVVEAGGLNVYVPDSMSFDNDIPRIVTFPRKTGMRDVGVPNTIN